MNQMPGCPPCVPDFFTTPITVDGVDEFIETSDEMSTDVPLNNVWQLTDTHVLFESQFSFAPLKPVNWKRRVVFVGNEYWILQDVLTGDDGKYDIEQNFQFEADVKGCHP